MENANTEDALLLTEGPNLYEFEKPLNFHYSKTRQPSFKISSPEMGEQRARSKSNSQVITPLIKSQHNLPESINNIIDSSHLTKTFLTVEEPSSNQDHSMPGMEEDINEENLSNATKENEEDDEEEEEYSEISSVIMEEDEEEDEIAEESEEKSGSDIEKDKENKKKEENNNEELSENKEKNPKEEEIEEKIKKEETFKEKETHRNTEILSENDSKEHIDLGMVWNDADPGLDSSNKLRYSEKYRNVQLILYPDDSFKSLWDMVLVLILAYTCIIMPFRIAFLSNDDNTAIWSIVDWTTDSFFYGDILVNFISAYYDDEDELIVSKKTIFWHYITGWFFFDLVGAFPIDQIVDVNRYGNLVRVSRLPRLYRLLKLTRLIRLLKIVKERNKIMKKFVDFLRISSGFERLFFSFLSIFVFCHISACFWYMTGELNDSQDNWITRFDYVDADNFDSYIASIYYIVQTVVTVGYGDINSGNSIERSFSCCLMFIGVFFYSFTIGSLSSLISNLDSNSARLDSQLNSLSQLRTQYNIDDDLYNRLKIGVKFGLTRYNFDKVEFLNKLPLNLRVELSVIMHRKLVEGIDFFENRPARFLAFIGPYLKAIKHGRDEYIFIEGEYADHMYFIKQGSVSLVLKDHHNFEYLKIEKGYYFGEVDLLFGDTRKTTVMSNGDVELLALNKKHFTRIFFQEFNEIGSQIFKNALKRKLRTKDIQKEAMEFCAKEKLGSFTERSSLLRKNNKNGFLPQISISKHNVQIASLKESELFTGSYKPFQKESFYIPRNTKEISYQIDKHLNVGERKPKNKEKSLENMMFNSLNLQKVLSNDINDAHSPKSSNQEMNEKEKESAEEKENKLIENCIKSVASEDKNNYELRLSTEKMKNKKGTYFEKFTSMLATPTVAKNYIPFDLDEDKKHNEITESIRKVDELQKKITNMDKNMEEILSVFKEMGMMIS